MRNSQNCITCAVGERENDNIQNIITIIRNENTSILLLVDVVFLNLTFGRAVKERQMFRRRQSPGV